MLISDELTTYSERTPWPGLCELFSRSFAALPCTCPRRRPEIRFKTGFRNTVYDTMLARPGWRETES